jgi:glutaredoxin 3
MKITIYSTATCGFCHMIKKFFDDHKVAYSVKMADESQEIAEELFEKSGQLGVPFTVLENDKGETTESILGFDIRKLNDLLQAGKLPKVA